MLLGIERSEEDEQLIREDEQWRRQHLERMMKGDAQAAEEIRESEARAEEEIEERLQQEDVYSIFDTFLYPADGADHFYTMLGDIEHVEKLMNSETEEWVYYLELNVMGQNAAHSDQSPRSGGRAQAGTPLYGAGIFSGASGSCRSYFRKPVHVLLTRWVKNGGIDIRIAFGEKYGKKTVLKKVMWRKTLT